MLDFLLHGVVAAAQSTMLSYQSGLLSVDTYAVKAYVDARMDDIINRKR